MNSRHILGGVILLGSLASCQSSSDPVSNQPSWKVPGVGSTYEYLITGTDSSNSGNTMHRDTLDYTVIANGISVGGKTNAIRFQSGKDGGYVVYEANGDVSLSDSSSSGFLWTVMPTGNHGTINVYPPFDTVDSDGAHHSRHQTRTYDGTERITTQAGSFDAIRIKETTTTLEESQGGDHFSTSESQILWFVPSLGFLGKSTSDAVILETISGDSRRDHSTAVLDLMKVNIK